MARKYPNILITGTPGVGKTTTALDLISSASSSTPPTSLKHLSINDIAKSKSFYESYDAELDTHVVDEDKLLDHLETVIEDGEGDGGWVLDWHVCDLFPERWIDLVVVLRCEDTKVFFQRLEDRKYNEKKMQENIDAEIFGVVAEEAREAYEESDVVELSSVNVEEVEENVDRIVKWIETWMENNKKSADGPKQVEENKDD